MKISNRKRIPSKRPKISHVITIYASLINGTKRPTYKYIDTVCVEDENEIEQATMKALRVSKIFIKDLFPNNNGRNQTDNSQRYRYKIVKTNYIEEHTDYITVE